MKNIQLLLILLTIILAFFGCVDSSRGTYLPNQTSTGYAYVHGGYVGMAEAKTDDKGNLTVYLDDAFLPHTIAIVDMESADWNESNTVGYTNRGKTSYFAKYVEYDGKVYVGVPTGDGFSYVEADDKGAPKGNVDLELIILRNQDTMAAYYKNVPGGKFKIKTSFAAAGKAVTTTSYGGVSKKKALKYWDSGQTWVGNITAIEKFIAEKGLQYSSSEMKQAAEPNDAGLKLWSVADAVTGATNSDFKDYFNVAQLAAGKLKTK